MAYVKQNFENGQTLEADHLNHIEDGILANERELENKQPKGNYMTEQSFKTINGQSIVGEGNIEISGSAGDSSGDDGGNSEYAPLAYIENTGTQNINTGYVIQENDILTFEYEIPESALSITGDKVLFMGYTSSKVSNVRVGTYGNAYKFYIRFGNTSSEEVTITDSASFMSGVISLSKESFSVNGVHMLTPAFKSALGDSTLYIPGTKSYVKVKSFKVHRDGELIKWYVPMLRKADEIPGLYEKVEGTFLVNTGSGMFIFPPPTSTGGNGQAVYAGTPTLTQAQKTAIHALMSDWYDNRDAFFYEYYHSLNAHASSQCYDSSKQKFKLCCATFVQNIMMGRSVNDFVGKNASTYSPTITKTDVSSFGYYFDFRYRRLLYGKTKQDEDGNTIGYYGFTRVNKDSDVGSFSLNTYYGDGNSTLYGQQFNNLNNANDMARELYEMGCEIHFSDLDIGDIWFTGDKHVGPNVSGYNASAWRNITHVGMVYDVHEVDGKKVIEWIECTSAFGSDIAIERNKLTDEDDFYKMMAYRVHANHVFCARLPVAFGYSPNVPTSVTVCPTP